MKKFLRWVAAGLLSLAAAVALYQNSLWTYYKKPEPRQYFSHEVHYLNRKGEYNGSCTSTAIGPHAILTAEHCDPNMVFGSITLDLSTHVFHILGYAQDDRDHTIYLLDGPAFKYYSKAVPGESKVGDKVVYYGFGGDEYPSKALRGRIISCGEYDYSDIDASQKELCFNLAVIPGDSGSAIYNAAGEIVGIVTYSFPTVDRGDICIGFSLNFPQEYLDGAYNFTGLQETQNGDNTSDTQTSGPNQPNR